MNAREKERIKDSAGWLMLSMLPTPAMRRQVLREVIRKIHATDEHARRAVEGQQ